MVNYELWRKLLHKNKQRLGILMIDYKHILDWYAVSRTSNWQNIIAGNDEFPNNWYYIEENNDDKISL